MVHSVIFWVLTFIIPPSLRTTRAFVVYVVAEERRMSQDLIAAILSLTAKIASQQEQQLRKRNAESNKVFVKQQHQRQAESQTSIAHQQDPFNRLLTLKPPQVPEYRGALPMIRVDIDQLGVYDALIDTGEKFSKIRREFIPELSYDWAKVPFTVRYEKSVVELANVRLTDRSTVPVILGMDWIDQSGAVLYSQDGIGRVMFLNDLERSEDRQSPFTVKFTQESTTFRDLHFTECPTIVERPELIENMFVCADPVVESPENYNPATAILPIDNETALFERELCGLTVNIALETQKKFIGLPDGVACSLINVSPLKFSGFEAVCQDSDVVRRRTRLYSRKTKKVAMVCHLVGSIQRMHRKKVRWKASKRAALLNSVTGLRLSGYTINSLDL